jgi:RHS repeat-associated protein
MPRRGCSKTCSRPSPPRTAAQRYVYYPYGGVAIYDANWNIVQTNTLNWQYLFQGGRYDWVSLYTFRHRDRSATLGRWIENDPIGFAAGDTNLGSRARCP